ncbi:hypothetical protein LLH06_17710 [Mucilaginibacter daejeonensis]|uniref:hypothetical protein n=1 Tax=Mucilaginibacter daejeonensis TaxID=398049 RepID=UPI001D1787E5|nr:hypothetical protein [Mucilaginibacter daejeonensis]UEG52785.1 hypothetical protein LLH06_17710 [Mucilaginibacter daejeonensis]
MKSTSRAAIYSVVIVLFVIGTYSLVKAHPEVQFAFYVPAVMVVMYAIIRDDLFGSSKAHLQMRHAVKGK